jgi:hypothetical protein
VTEILTGYGPLGVAVLALGAAVMKLYRDLEKLRDKREDDVKTILSALSTGAAANTRFADSLEEFTNRLPGWISGQSRKDRGGPYR